MAQSTELDELKQAMKEMKEEITSIRHENASMKDTIQAMRSEMLPVLENCHQRLPERGVKTTIMETVFTNPKFLTDKEKKGISFEMSSYQMQNMEFNDLKPSRWLSFKAHSLVCIKPFLTLEDGRFTTPIAGDYRFRVEGTSRFEENGAKEDKVNWYLCHVPKQFDVSENIAQVDHSDEEEEETEESLLKMSIFNENKRQLFLFSTDTENDTQERPIAIECDRDIVFWIEAVVVEGACKKYSIGVEFSGILVR